MAVSELYKSRRKSRDTSTRKYIITGESTEDNARTALASAAPSTLGTLVRDPNYEVDELGGNNWLGTVEYTTPNSPEQSAAGSQATGWKKISFSTNGGSQHVTQAIAQTAYAPNGETAPNFDGAIGVQGHGQEARPEGVDIALRAFGFTITKVVAASALTKTYIAALYARTATVNNAVFSVTDSRGINIELASGEGLLLGVDMSDHQDADKVVLTFTFVAAPNKTGLSVGANISSIAKKGHEYLWVHYVQQSDTNSKRIVQKPIAAYVARVYELTDWSALSI